jgi:hypothetical protein
VATGIANSLITGSITNLVNGVSQQPFTMRLPSQAEAITNGYGTVADGLFKRPPTKFVAKLVSTLPTTATIHVIERGDDERYVLILQPGSSPRVFDFAGNEKTVNFPQGNAYALAAGKFRAVTVADHTFILNTGVKPAMAADVAPGLVNRGIVWVRQGNYSTSYTVILDNASVFTYKTDTTDPSTIDTVNIAAQLQALIAASGTYAASAIGALLVITRANGADFTVRTQDSIADTGLLAVKGKVQDISLLPAKAIVGTLVEVSGAANNPYDNYWLTYRTQAGLDPYVGGVWAECNAPGRKYKLDKLTMPHVLVREANGTFTFKPGDWDECETGDAITNPEPSFIGKTVNDLFFFRNRLGVICDENVILSKGGQFFDFWRDTATALLDTDPIDIAISHVKVSILKYAVPFNEALLLFADKTQFILRAGDILSPNSVSVSQITEFETANSVRPEAAGRFVFFSTERGGFGGVREFYVMSGETQTHDANDVTSHVPRYIPGEITMMASSTNEDTLLCHTKSDPSVIYVYKYMWSGNQKAQSSWSRWTFQPDTKVLSMAFSRSTLWLVLARGDGVFLERMDIAPALSDPGIDYTVHLDHRVTFNGTGVYNPTTNQTVLTLPVALDDVQVVAMPGDATYKAGSPVPVTWKGSNGKEIAVRGNLTKAVIGRPYVFEHTFSPLLIRKQAPGGGYVADTSGRVQVRRLTINYAASGYFRFEVTPLGRNTYTTVFTGRVLGSVKNVLGAPAIDTGTFRVPIMANNMNVEIKLINDTPFPSRFLNAEWEAMYTVRSIAMD